MGSIGTPPVWTGRKPEACLHTLTLTVASCWLKGFKAKNAVSEWEAGISVCHQATSVWSRRDYRRQRTGFFFCGFPSLQGPIGTPEPAAASLGIVYLSTRPAENFI